MSAVRTTCPYCGVGCGLTVRAAAARADSPAAQPPAGRGAAAFEIAGDPEHPANRGRLCSKGAALAETLGLEGRLLHPEIDGRRVGWDRALATVAQGFAKTIAEFGPESVAFYVSGQLLTEDYYVANKLMKGFIGGGNIDTNSRLCMASAVAGHKRAFGTDTVPCSYEDVDDAELVVLVGSNAAWCHPVLFQRLLSAKAQRPELEIVVIDPRRTATAESADLFLQLRPGTDAVLFNGLLRYLHRQNALDREYIAAHTHGFEAALRAASDSGSTDEVAAACGLEEAAVLRFFGAFARTPRTVTLFSQGVGQSSSGTDKINAIINTHLATGRIGKRGAGPFSLTGQPNAMGGREVGGLANQLAAHMGFGAADVERVRRFWNVPAVAERPGLKAVELFDAIGAGRIKAVWIMCTNPVVTMPDADRVQRALERCDLVVVSDCVRDTDTTRCADVLLPAATWGEKTGTVTNSERRISRQRAFVPPPGEARPDWWIVTQVARRMGFASGFPYESPYEIFTEHARLSAFENGGRRTFDIGALADLRAAEYEALEPVRWPIPRGASALPGAAAVFADGRFPTSTGKARFVPIRPRPPVAHPDETFPLVLNTGRTRDHWHTMTRTGASARLSGHRPEPFVEVHSEDARRCSVADGDLAQVSAAEGRLILRVRVVDTQRPGAVFVPMHWGRDRAASARVGTLIPAHTDPVSGQPELKHARARLEAYRPAWQAFLLSRRPLRLPADGYAALARERDHWRHELGGDGPLESWPQWSRSLADSAGDWIEYYDPAAGRYRAALLRDERLEACVFVGAGSALPPRDWISSLFEGSRLDAQTRLGLLAGRPVAGREDRGPLVCACFSVGRRTLVAAIRAGRADSVDAIGKTLKAGTSCGSCLPELRALLAEAPSRDSLTR